eukprot:m.133735 g.133735  ORF g.133735 m.133735 type:complete len:55 (+) comp15807_c0_seq3:74-238(+)
MAREYQSAGTPLFVSTCSHILNISAMLLILCLGETHRSGAIGGQAIMKTTNTIH